MQSLRKKGYVSLAKKVLVVSESAALTFFLKSLETIDILLLEIIVTPQR